MLSILSGMWLFFYLYHLKPKNSGTIELTWYLKKRVMDRQSKKKNVVRFGPNNPLFILECFLLKFILSLSPAELDVKSIHLSKSLSMDNIFLIPEGI